ncbi:hypothetical protein [Chelativorans sp.]|uniref:hypothetical protein n=1 Tax=Chelativorans sp. TaxID=2203393 RepID=UPI002810DDB0|nr:hypothetical protein [Chelativorans sp.]
MAEYLWFFVVAIMPFLIGALVIYALLKRRRLTPTEKVVRDDKTRELYGDRQ